MFTGVLSRWMVGLVVAVMTAPAALACENPDNIVIALWKAPPAAMEPGEVVVEVDFASMKTIQTREVVLALDKPAVQSPIGEPVNAEMRYFVSYATFPALRVVRGDFADKVVRIETSLWSSCTFIGGSEGKYVVGRPAVDGDGISYIKVRWLKAAAYDAQHEQNREAAN